MRSLGVREWASLGMLIVGLLITVSFYIPGATGDSPRTPSLGTIPGRTPTEEPGSAAQPLAPPTGWTARYLSLEDESVTAEATLDELDLAFPGAPPGSFEDDAWRVVARTELDLGEGRYRFELEYRGHARVVVDGEEVFDAIGDGSEPSVATVRFRVQGSGPVQITVHGEDREGVFVLRWRAS